MATRTKIADILRKTCSNAYWYGEDYGDYAMKHVDTEAWFGGAIEELLEVCNEYAEYHRFD